MAHYVLAFNNRHYDDFFNVYGYVYHLVYTDNLVNFLITYTVN